jgi:hypothetical protein
MERRKNMSKKNKRPIETDDEFHRSCSTADQEKNCSGDSDAKSGCCDAGNNEKFMPACMEKCKYFVMVPVVLGIILLLLGIFLSPSVIVALWIIGASLILGMGVLGLLASRFMTVGLC